MDDPAGLCAPSEGPRPTPASLRTARDKGRSGGMAWVSGRWRGERASGRPRQWSVRLTRLNATAWLSQIASAILPKGLTPEEYSRWLIP